MQLPLLLRRRGLLGFMDEQDKPRGLFSLFDREEDPASPADDGVDHEAQARWAADPAFQDARIEELRNLLTLPDPLPRDPETLVFLRQLQAVGSGLSGGTANATGYGPWAFPWPGGPSGPSAMAASTLMRAPQRPPWAVPSAGPMGQSQPGPYGWPQAETQSRPQPGPFPGQVNELENQSYYLPPEDDLGEDETTGHRRVRGGGKYWFPETKEPGPLERLKLKNPELEDPVKSFRGGAYFERELPEDTVFYRVWGRPEGTKKGASELGRWWTKTPPSSPVQSTIDSAIQPRWGNTFQTMTSIRVPKGATVYYGDVGPQEALVGGGWQYYLPKVDPEWIMTARPFR